VKRKRAPAAEPAPPEGSLSPTPPPAAMLEPEKNRKGQNCVICGDPCAPNSSEGLCWVCRRLKLSAWRDTDTQMPAQE
jgi:hypothetical protein